MKNIVLFSFVLLLFACSENKTRSPSETAKVVAESFYHDDEETLKKHTTASGFENLLSIQSMFAQDKDSKTEFKIVEEATEGDVVWIKYTTDFDPKASIFKLIKEDDQWKVTHNGPRDKGSF